MMCQWCFKRASYDKAAKLENIVYITKVWKIVRKDKHRKYSKRDNLVNRKWANLLQCFENNLLILGYYSSLKNTWHFLMNELLQLKKIIM